MSSLTTKKAIVLSFRKLLEKKPVTKITINEIANETNINRQTFYYHFNDITDLITWICTFEFNKKMQKYKDCSWDKQFLEIFNLINEEEKIIDNILHSVSKEIVYNNLCNLIYPTMYEEISEMININIKEKDKIFIVNFYKYAFVSIVLKWIEQGRKQDPKEIIRNIKNIVNGTLNEACKQFSKR